MRWVECTGPEGQRGRLRPSVANAVVALWGHDILQQWNTQINILHISETDHKQTHVCGKNIIRHYLKKVSDHPGYT